MRVEFATANRIVFGPGVFKEIAVIAPTLGNNALVVSGKGGANHTNLLELLKSAGVNWTHFLVQGEPTVDQVMEGVERARSARVDVIIGFGGGSVLDTGKAIAGMLENSGSLVDYLEGIGKGKVLSSPGVPYIAIPTTAGTGSEVTRNAVIAVPEQRVKASLRSPYLLPRVALIDPELTYSMSPAVTASTGMDALTQVLEPYVSRRSNPMTDLFCREGMEKAARSLAMVYRQGDDAQAREDMAWVSLLGGLALANAGLGAVHGFAAPIGGMFDAPHGAVCACLLPLVEEANVKALKDREPGSEILNRYEQIAKILVRKEQAKIEDGIEWLFSIREELQIPGLGAYGVTRQDIPELIANALKASSMKANPVALSEIELTHILERAI